MASILHIVDPKGCEEISQPFFRVRPEPAAASSPEITVNRKESDQ